MFNLREFLGLSYFVSALDQFLKAFDRKKTTLSASQRKEVEKYKRIYQLRDDPNAPTPKDIFWDKF